MDLCANCTVCHGLVWEQDEPRILSLSGPEKSKVLVIDDATSQDAYAAAIELATRLLTPLDLDYTSTIRCDHDPDEMGSENYQRVASSCSVWTHLLADGRSLILTTTLGLDQLKVGAKRDVGEAFKVGRLGVILVIPPLLEMEAMGELVMYREKVKRVMKEAGLA